ncbi:hypothetical protein ABEG18_24755 [Alsobacter sp. KACC 23698]|uniref:Uncharacterized protein n=1 Tax=Alsobacter sp. KACC 23698 TaxID=3149229 RepID=A0AAU7JEQ4_9HYPH
MPFLDASALDTDPDGMRLLAAVIAPRRGERARPVRGAPKGGSEATEPASPKPLIGRKRTIAAAAGEKVGSSRGRAGL